MPARALCSPPANLHSLSLPLVEMNDTWFRSHRTGYASVYYGRSNVFRFDDPCQKYGVLYVAQDGYGAFIETFGQMLGDEVTRLPPILTTDSLRDRALSEIKCARPLRLVDLTGSGLARLGADARLFAGPREHCRQWSRALHDHPDRRDGILYPTRHDPCRKAAAIVREEDVQWVDLSRRVGMETADLPRILKHYGFALVESRSIPQPVRKPANRQGLLDL